MNQKNSPELQLLLACLRKDNIHSLCNNIIDWDAFINLCHRHRVIPQIYHQLKISPAPGAIILELHKCSFQQAQDMLKLTRELICVVNLFKQNKIPLLSLKGPALAQDLYGAVGLRSSTDLDFLTSVQHIQAAEKLLLSIGYKRTEPDFDLSPRQFEAILKITNEFKYWNPKVSLKLELHWQFFSLSYLCDLKLEDWNKTGFVELAGTRVQTLLLEDNILYLCTHGAMHAWFRLRWLYDLAMIIEKKDLDWAMLLERADKLKVSRFLCQGLELAHVLLGTKIPAVKADQNLVDLAFLIIQHPDESGHYFSRLYFLKKIYRFNLLKTMHLKLQYIIDGFKTVPDDWKTIKLPDRFFPLYHILRPLIWIDRIFSK